MDMLKTLWATVQKGKIELLEASNLAEGTKVRQFKDEMQHLEIFA